MATQQEIAEHAQVSVSTVWRVLNNPESVDPSTRSAVMKAAKELGYDKAPIQKRRKSNLHLIAFLVSDLTNPFFSLIIKGCESIARTHGYRLTVSDSENDMELERTHMESIIESNSTGVILIPSGSKSEASEVAVAENMPIVLVDRYVNTPDISSITTDNKKGAYLATKYLLRIGHKEILFVYGGKGKSSSDERLEGFRNALTENNVTPAEEYIIDGKYDFDIAYQGVKAAIEQGTTFSAVFASADVMAFGAKRALEECGYVIPRDVSLVGYDDIPLASSIALTTVAQPALEMGRNALFLLMDLIEGRVTEPSHIVLQPSLIIRETCMGR